MARLVLGLYLLGVLDERGAVHAPTLVPGPDLHDLSVIAELG
jgi:hypothetical protein